MKKLWDLKNVFSNLELEGQGHGIIMGVTHLLLLGPFYTIQTNFLYFFAHDCIRLECGQRINFFIIYDFCRSMHSRDCPILTHHPWWIISDLLSPLTTELSKECSLWTWFKEKRLLCHIFVWYLKLNKNKRLRKRIKKRHQDGWKTILPQANVISYY